MFEEVLRAACSLLLERGLHGSEWPSSIHCVQSVINQTPPKRFEKARDGKSWRCPTEAFTSMQPRLFFVKLFPPVAANSQNIMLQERAILIVRANDVHKVLEVMHKELSDNSQKMQAKSQQTHTATTNVVSFNFHKWAYVMMHPSNVRHEKLSTRWIGSMRIVDTKSDFMLVVKDLHKVRSFTVHAQLLLPYPTQPSRMKVHRRFLEHAECLDSSLQLVDAFHDVRVRDRKYEIFAPWQGWISAIDRA